MAVRIRLARAGAKKKPFYRVVVADKRMPRDGRFIEIVGRYNPRSKPTLVELELDRIREWIDKGAIPSETVSKLIAIAEAPDAAAPETAKDRRPSAKQAAAAKDAEDKAAAASEEAATADEAPADEAPAEEAEAADESPAEEAADEADDADESTDEADEADSEDE